MTPSLDITGGRATIRLRRPDKRNRIEPADLVALSGHLGEVAQRCAPDAGPERVAVLVIEAEGPSWCSGFHLGALAEGERVEVSFGDVCDQIETLAVPTIAALAGNVHGGGTDLAVSCDFRVGASGIVLGMPAARIGLQYYASGLRRFVERIGPTGTKRLFLTAETISAEELLRIGYLTELVPADSHHARVDALCASICALAPLAVVNTKAAINALAGLAPDIDAIEAGARATSRSADHKEAMRAMQERRPPVFRGA